jgi:hypothetical protein
MTGPIRFALDEKQFRQLVKGQVLRLTALDGTLVEIILSDIGFDRMTFAVLAANEKSDEEFR